MKKHCESCSCNDEVYSNQAVKNSLDFLMDNNPKLWREVIARIKTMFMVVASKV